MHFTCAFCDARVPVNPMFDTSTCPGCRQELANGLAKKFRKALEKKHYWMKRPKSVMARAASYSNRIYEFAAEGASMRFAEVEGRIVKRFGAGASANSAVCTYKAGRGVLDMSDDATGCMVVEVDGNTGGRLWRYVYVVLRGSAGGPSTHMSGWDQSGTHNVDWRANLENEQARPPWGAPDCKVHQGFLHVYMTMRTGLKAAVAKSIRNRPKGAECIVVVCGHSLGGGLTQLCAHDFHSSGLGKGEAAITAFPFCPPRAGNLGFVRHFNAELCDTEVFYPSETKSYTRAVSTVQGLDPVSIGQTRSARRGMTPREATITVDGGGLMARGLYAGDILGINHEDLSDLIAEEEQFFYGQQERSRFNLIGRGQDWMKRRKRHKQSQAIYYHIKNLYLISLIGLHMPFDNFMGIEGNAYSSFH